MDFLVDNHNPWFYAFLGFVLFSMVFTAMCSVVCFYLRVANAYKFPGHGFLDNQSRNNAL